MIEALLDFVFPKVCQGCSQEGSYLCILCQDKIQIPQERCLFCSKPSLLGRIHADCRSGEFFLEGILVAADYQNQATRNLIWHLKYHSVQAIAEILATLMADYFVQHELLDYFAASAVIPVPLHKKRLRARGFNQAEVLAKLLADKLGFQYLPILEKTKPSKRQVDLERGQRLENVQGLFWAPALPSLGERKIILVDDVAATGATLNECAKVLKKQEVSEVWGLVVARN